MQHNDSSGNSRKRQRRESNASHSAAIFDVFMMNVDEGSECDEPVEKGVS
jgi:hypothetical protein